MIHCGSLLNPLRLIKLMNYYRVPAHFAGCFATQGDESCREALQNSWCCTMSWDKVLIKLHKWENSSNYWPFFSKSLSFCQCDTPISYIGWKKKGPRALVIIFGLKVFWARGLGSIVIGASGPGRYSSHVISLLSRRSFNAKLSMCL